MPKVKLEKVGRKKNVAGRMRERWNPYATWTDTQSGWKYHLLKSWQADNGEIWARWFVRVEGWSDEMGDQYVAEIRPGLRGASDVVVDTSVWPTLPDFWEWAKGSGG